MLMSSWASWFTTKDCKLYILSKHDHLLICRGESFSMGMRWAPDPSPGSLSKFLYLSKPLCLIYKENKNNTVSVCNALLDTRSGASPASAAPFVLTCTGTHLTAEYTQAARVSRLALRSQDSFVEVMVSIHICLTREPELFILHHTAT